MLVKYPNEMDEAASHDWYLFVINSIHFMSVEFYTCNMQKHSISQAGPGSQEVIRNFEASMSKGIKEANKHNCLYLSPSMYSFQVSCRLWSMSAESSTQAVRVADILKVDNHSGRGKDITAFKCSSPEMRYATLTPKPLAKHAILLCARKVGLQKFLVSCCTDYHGLLLQPLNIWLTPLSFTSKILSYYSKADNPELQLLGVG